MYDAKNMADVVSRKEFQVLQDFTNYTCIFN